MNQRQAGNILKRSAPPGEFPAFINPQEASFLRGMGGKGKKTKSGLRSFALPSEEQSQLEGGDSSYQYTLSGDGPMNIRGALEERGILHRQDSQAAKDEHARVANMNMPGFDNQGRPIVPGVGVGGGGGISSPNLPNPTNPFSGGGHDTKIPQGPGSVTNPNDPYGLQEKVALGAKKLIDKAYVKPTLTPEQRIAADSTQTLQARQAVQDMVGTGQGAYGEAAAVGKRISGQEIDPISGQSFLTGQGVDAYMSPHTSNVIAGMQDNAMRTMQKQRGAIGAASQMAGAGVGSRDALEKAAMSAEVQRGLGQQVSGALEGSYAQAAQMKEADMARNMQRQRYNQLATGEQGRLNLAGAAEQRAGTAAGRDAAAADINMLSGVGADVEGKQQNILDEKMHDFYEEQSHPERMLAAGANIGATQPTGSTTTTTGAPQHKKRDKYGRVITGAAGGWLATGGNPWGAVVGGGAALVS